MNIISNNCLGGFIYKYAKCSYGSPFIWTAIYGSSLEQIIFNYDSINFNDVWLHDVSGRKTYNLVIDNKLDVKFWSHYKYDANSINPQKRGDSIYCANIEQYIVSTYTKRRLRMVEPPVFILHWWLGMSTGTPDYWKGSPPTNDFQYLRQLCHTPNKYKLLVYHPYKDFADGSLGNTKWVYEDLCAFPKRSPAFVAKKRLDEILSYVN